MKYRSVARLAYRNIMDNKMRFVMSFAIFTLLAVVIITLGNAIFACRKSIDSSLIHSVNENGINAEIRGVELQSEQVDKFIDIFDKRIGFEKYYAEVRYSPAKIDGRTMNIGAFYGGKKCKILIILYWMEMNGMYLTMHL